ncbi:TPA: phage tail protein [Klebsiella pneumoniae]
MATKYFALLTNIGAAKLANATALGAQVEITQMAVGDGNGVLPTPNQAQTALTHELRRAQLNMLTIDPVNTNQIIAEQVIPEDAGGWWIREIGLFDKDGDMIAVANCAETYKPQLQEGSGRVQVIRVILIVSSTEAVTLKIDPSVVLATRKYVDDAVIEVKAYADDVMKKHVAAANPHKQYPLIANALKEMVDAGLVNQILENLGLIGGLSSTTTGRLIGVRVITSSGTYTPTAGTNAIAVMAVGGGGAGGGTAATTASTSAAAGGGGAGAQVSSLLTTGFSGVTVTIGAGGTAVVGGAGNNGGNTLFGSLITANGGLGGKLCAAQTPPLYSSPGKGGTGTGGTIYNKNGDTGAAGMIFNAVTAVSGKGASSVYGCGGSPQGISSQAFVYGDAATGYGSGGSGGVSGGGGASSSGGAGSPGVIIVMEYA